MAWHEGVWLDVQTDLSSLRASDFGLYIFKEAIPLYRLISGARFRRQIPCELKAGLQELLDFIAYVRELSVL